MAEGLKAGPGFTSSSSTSRIAPLSLDAVDQSRWICDFFLFSAAAPEDAAHLACRHGPLYRLQDGFMSGPHLGSGDGRDLPRRYQKR